MRHAITLLLAGLALAAAAPLAAQSASIQANANVLAPISASGQQDLNFGDVIPGFDETVAPGDVDAGRYHVSGAGNLEVSLDFGTLPTTLSHATSGATLPISFAAGSAGYGSTSGSVDATFDPNSGTTTDLDAGDLYVFLGGTVSPATGQDEGTYSETITLSVSYTGN